MVKENGLIYIKFFDIINNYIERKKWGIWIGQYDSILNCLVLSNDFTC